MSAVDDVAARIQRLEASHALKSQQLRQLQHELRYNPLTGVDERLDSGQSAAKLEFKVDGGRNVLFKAGFLSGQRTYIRVTVECVAADGGTLMERQVTTKTPVGYTPRWNEVLVFQGLPAAVGTLRLDVMQEERIGADEVVGTFMMPLASLQHQRRVEKWQVLKKHDKDLISELLFSCRFNRSPISAMELEMELLQNQVNELHLFVGRHQNLVGMPQPSSAMATMASAKPLQGVEVVAESMPERTASTRFSAVASFPPAMRKREFTENISTMNVEMQEAPRAKRQRVADTEKQVNSLSDRIANWLMPTSTGTPRATAVAKADPSTPQVDGSTAEGTGMVSSQFFPFKQRQTTSAPRKARRTGRPLTSAPPKTPSALQAIEKWLFTDKEGKPRELPFGRQAPSY
ncbi:hypothetical protein PHYBOEH_010223 [Phytophthora boehmeriae]|uniref:C2 domain-containing protein n=1 Tax=Phytophthora boehmeriae TaxID=109152 RepID=A0A8T1VNJ0_9STRA|nr:hypothetical protein PHYBOEH_010223 [Phytophthora boehmeriae]